MNRWKYLLSLTVLLGACSSDPASAPGDESETPPEEEPTPASTYQSGLEVAISGGDVLGQRDGDLRVFKNLPFAAPPVGDLRFRDPRPVVPWDGIRDATAFGPSCSQSAGPLAGATGVSEDCLQLNVWAFDDARPRPVMVFIHGGAFFGGSATQELYDAANLARRGEVTLVTINYRLGVAGFLASPELEDGTSTSGNYGLKDQVAALEWVQGNIEIFGGDPNNVTVFGESAGGISICGLMAAPRADELYHKVIVQSGVGCGRFVEAEQGIELGQPSAIESGELLIEELGCAEAADKAACLRALDIDDLVATIDPVDLVLGGLDQTLPIAPHVDGSFMVEQPLARISRGERPVPTLLGTTADEATLFFGSTSVLNRVDFWFKVREFLGSDELADGVLDIYSFADYPIAKSAFLDFVTDFAFSCPNLEFARAAGAHEPVYLYEFQRVVPALFAMGSFHGLELAYLFGNFKSLSLIPSPVDTELVEVMQRAWTQFAHNAEPALASGWPALESEGEPVAALNAEPEVFDSSEFRGGRCEDLKALGLSL